LDTPEFVTYYETGQLLVDDSLDTIRLRALAE